jgi:hypothetical protein
MFDLTLDAPNCKKCLKARGNDGVIVKKAATMEEFFCLDCWLEMESAFHWAGVLCVVVLTETGFRSPQRINDLVNRLFGRQFNWLQFFDFGFLLRGNETFIEQPSLF